MRIVGSSEARTHWYALLRDVEYGETVMITRYGVPVALIFPDRDPVNAADSTNAERYRIPEENNAQQGSDNLIRESTGEGHE